MTTETAGPFGASDSGPTSTGSRTTMILGIVTLVALGVLVLFGLILSPADENQGDAVRIMYVHVPSATLSYVGCFLTAIGSVVFLWRKSRWWDLVAYASAEVAALFTAFTLVTGMLWGRPTWGVFWVWDARLTSELILLFLYLGFMALQASIDNRRRADKAGAILALVGVVNIPIIYFSVKWWNTLHQGASVSLTKAPAMAQTMLWGMLLMALCFWMYSIAVGLMRVRAIILEREAHTDWVRQLSEVKS